MQKQYAKDQIGKKFGRLTVLALAEPMRYPGVTVSYLHCRCECGNEKTVRWSHLLRGKIQSCKCLQTERVQAQADRRRIDPELRRIRNAWKSMIHRCYSPSQESYVNYGAKGVRVCDQWQSRDGFKRFLRDMGLPPTRDHSIDRIDANGNYEPTNCRWATCIEQARNKRNTVFLEFNGVKKPLVEWAEEIGLAPRTLHNRVFLLGWTVAEALTTPSLHHKGPRRPKKVINTG
jgi:hypothetical protein